MDVEDAYQKHWKEFETGFWETEGTWAASLPSLFDLFSIIG